RSIDQQWIAGRNHAGIEHHSISEVSHLAGFEAHPEAVAGRGEAKAAPIDAAFVDVVFTAGPDVDREIDVPVALVAVTEAQASHRRHVDRHELQIAVAGADSHGRYAARVPG